MSNYKVLAFYGLGMTKNTLYDVNDNNYFSPDGCSYPMSLINLEEHKIHTVERLSDGQIFTLGDTVKSMSNIHDQPIDYMKNKEHIIYSFQDNNVTPLNSHEEATYKGLWISTHHSKKQDWIPLDDISNINSKKSKIMNNIKDYEINVLSLVDGTLLYYDKGLCTYRTDGCSPISTLPAEKAYENHPESHILNCIKKITRMTDNTVFAVGDIVNKHGIIKQIRINDGYYQFNCNDVWFDCNALSFNHTITSQIQHYQGIYDKSIAELTTLLEKNKNRRLLLLL